MLYTVRTNVIWHSIMSQLQINVMYKKPEGRATAKLTLAET